MLHCLLLYCVCAIASLTESSNAWVNNDNDLPRPSLPNNTMIQGWWECTKESAICISPIIIGYRGMVQVYLEFDYLTGTLIQSREDATVNCSSFVYNREYLINGILYEYSMFSINSTSFTCSQLTGTSMIPQNLFINATYIGQTTFDNILANEFEGTWMVRSEES